jgi:hypothetical protein
MNDEITVWSIWKHKNGINYRVSTLANTQSTKEEYPPSVVYENCQTGTIWVRPIKGWHESFTKVRD